MVRFLIYSFFSIGSSLVYADSPQRLCFAATTQSVQTGSFTAMKPASKETAQKASAMTVPDGYRVEGSHSDENLDLKYLVLSPPNPGDNWILAVSGPPARISQLQDLVYALTNCEYRDANGRILAAQNWTITGAANGAELAQTFMNRVQERRLLKNLTAAPLDLVIFK